MRRQSRVAAPAFLRIMDNMEHRGMQGILL